MGLKLFRFMRLVVLWFLSLKFGVPSCWELEKLFKVLGCLVFQAVQSFISCSVPGWSISCRLELCVISVFKVEFGVIKGCSFFQY